MDENKLGDDRLGGFGDAFYEQLMQAHEGLNPSESIALNARLILLMANEIGNSEKLELILQTAKH